MDKAYPPPPSIKYAKRIQQMKGGLDELENWLHDTLQQGLITLEQQPDFWKDISARMVDAKLGAIGRRLKLLRLKVGKGDKWYEEVSAELGNLYLLASAIKNIETLPPLLQQDVLTMAGVSIRKETLLEDGILIEDNWMCLATSEKEEDNLRSRRTWVYGWETNRFGLILDFAWGRTPFKGQYTAGEVFWGKLIYYPSNTPLRLIVNEKKVLKDRTIKKIIGFFSFSDCLIQYAKTLAANPWIIDFPCALESVTPVLQDERIFLLDNQQQMLPISLEYTKKMQLLAVSGGHPINLFGEWQGNTILPLSASVDQRFITFV